MSARLAWTAERVQTLSKLWLDGRSASEIARVLAGGATRNSVIGKVHRLGLSGRERPRAPPKRSALRVRSAEPRPRAPTIARPPRSFRLAPASFAVVDHSEPGLATVLTLTAHACRWPLGDPASDGLSFCGRAVTRGAYCAEHGAMAYRPPVEQPRPDRLLRLAHLV